MCVFLSRGEVHRVSFSHLRATDLLELLESTRNLFGDFFSVEVDLWSTVEDVYRVVPLINAWPLCIVRIACSYAWKPAGNIP